MEKTVFGRGFGLFDPDSVSVAIYILFVVLLYDSFYIILALFSGNTGSIALSTIFSYPSDFSQGFVLWHSVERLIDL